MLPSKKITSEELHRLHDDFLDSLDEELEMELDDLRGPDGVPDGVGCFFDHSRLRRHPVRLGTALRANEA